MTPGVSFNSRSSLATWATITGAFDANYPVGNLGDTIHPSMVSRATPSVGQVSVTFTLPAVSSLQFLALVRHNMLTSQSLRVRLFSSGAPNPATNAGAIVYDSTSVPVWPGGGAVTNYPGVRPLALPAALNVLSGLIDITGITGVLELGAVDIGLWWPWAGEGVGRQFGHSTRLKPIDLIGGAVDVISTWKPRTLTAEIPFIAMSTAATTGLDFQKLQGLSKPFVYVADYDDPTSWPRECALMRNSSLPPSVGQVYRSDKFQFKFIEHFR